VLGTFSFAAKVGAPLSIALFLVTEKHFNRLHNCDTWMCNAVVFHFSQILFERVNFYNRIVSLPIIVAAQPKSDIVWIGNFIASELLAGNLRDINCDLRLRGRNYNAKENRA
jgi:hypothetical protein